MFAAVSRIQAGDLLTFFQRHEAALLGYAIRLTSSRDLAEDLVQETFAKLLKHGLAGLHSPKGFLFATAHNLAMDYHRHRAAIAIENLADLDTLQLCDASANPQAQLIAREGLRALCQALDELPTQQRRVFTLRKVYNLSHAEIADELGITISTAQKHLTKALAHDLLPVFRPLIT